MFVADGTMDGLLPAHLNGGGEAGALMRRTDWTATPLGAPEAWPAALTTLTAVLFAAAQPMILVWGPERISLCNDAFAAMLGDRSPAAMGRPLAELCSGLGVDIEPVVAEAYAGRPAQADHLIDRSGGARKMRFTVSCTPVRGAAGLVQGVLCVCTETSAQPADRRRLAAEVERQRRIYQQAPGFICITEGPDHVFSFANNAFSRLFGERDLIGRTTREALPDLGDQGLFEELDQIYATGRRFVGQGQPVRLRSAPGSQPENRVLDFVFEPMTDEAGRVTGIFCEGFDVTEAVAAREALRRSEEFSRRVLASSDDCIKMLDLDGRLETMSEGGRRALGLQDLSAVTGREWADMFEPEGRAAAWAAVEDARAGCTARFEAALRTRLGELRDWDSVLTPVAGADGRPEKILALSRDITVRKRAEARLIFGEEQLRLATEAAEIALWDLDVAAGSLFWPARLKAMFGMAPDAPVSMTQFETGLHLDDRERVMAAFVAACDPAVRSLYDVEYRAIGLDDGVVRWVAAKGRGLFDGDVLTRVVGVAIDVTARKADEARLRELNETLEQQVEQRTAERNRVWSMSRDLLAVMGFDGYLKAINPAWESTLGFDQAELLARPFGRQVHPDDHAAVIGVMERLRRGETVEKFEDRLLDSDGRWRWISWTLVPEDDVFYAVGRDVTPEKTAAAELLQAQEALRQSQKMEAMGQLTGGVAHDFNNLLTPIVGGLDMLQRRGLGGPREQRLIDAALQSADRAKTLVQRLLAFARRQPLQAGSVDVARLVTGMADLVASTSGPQIKVVLEAVGDLPPANADANQLEMALLNLGVNARDAMPDGGVLRITADQEQIEEGHRSGLAPGSYIRLSVADTGVGMDEAVLARAVEPFFSTKGVGRGTGLGLSMVHGLASQLGGALAIDSRPGVGTNIELWLPVSAQAADPAAAAPDEARFEADRATALLVDDEELVRMSTADMLTDLGYTVVESGSAENALAMIEGGLRPDLVVTDHLMPGMTGTDLARRLKAQRPDLPVLVVSGYAED